MKVKLTEHNCDTKMAGFKWCNSSGTSPRRAVAIEMNGNDNDKLSPGIIDLTDSKKWSDVLIECWMVI